MEKKILEMKNTITEIKTAAFGLISALEEAEEKINELEIISSENRKAKRIMTGGKKKILKQTNPEENVQGLWESYKRYNTRMVEITEEKRRRRRMKRGRGKGRGRRRRKHI